MEELNFIKYNITNHAMERYAERIMNKENPTDIRMFINEHRQDINDRINKLINYGNLIYEGKLREHPVNQYFYKDRWVNIVDPKTKNVITLYKIDLGDEEVTDLFITKTLQRINESKKMLNITINNISAKNKEYQDIINEAKSDIEYHKKMIKSLEENIECYEILMKNLNNEVLKAEDKLKDDIQMLIAKKQF